MTAWPNEGELDAAAEGADKERGEAKVALHKASMRKECCAHTERTRTRMSPDLRQRDVTVGGLEGGL